MVSPLDSTQIPKNSQLVPGGSRDTTLAPTSQDAPTVPRSSALVAADSSSVSSARQLIESQISFARIFNPEIEALMRDQLAPRLEVLQSRLSLTEGELKKLVELLVRPSRDTSEISRNIAKLQVINQGQVPINSREIRDVLGRIELARMLTRQGIELNDGKVATLYRFAGGKLDWLSANLARLQALGFNDSNLMNLNCRDCPGEIFPSLEDLVKFSEEHPEKNIFNVEKPDEITREVLVAKLAAYNPNLDLGSSKAIETRLPWCVSEESCRLVATLDKVPQYGDKPRYAHAEEALALPAGERGSSLERRFAIFIKSKLEEFGCRKLFELYSDDDDYASLPLQRLFAEARTSTVDMNLELKDYLKIVEIVQSALLNPEGGITSALDDLPSHQSLVEWFLESGLSTTNHPTEPKILSALWLKSKYGIQTEDPKTLNLIRELKQVERGRGYGVRTGFHAFERLSKAGIGDAQAARLAELLKAEYGDGTSEFALAFDQAFPSGSPLDQKFRECSVLVVASSHPELGLLDLNVPAKEALQKFHAHRLRTRVEAQGLQLNDSQLEQVMRFCGKPNILLDDSKIYDRFLADIQTSGKTLDEYFRLVELALDEQFIDCYDSLKKIAHKFPVIGIFDATKPLEEVRSNLSVLIERARNQDHATVPSILEHIANLNLRNPQNIMGNTGDVLQRLQYGDKPGERFSHTGIDSYFDEDAPDVIGPLAEDAPSTTALTLKGSSELALTKQQTRAYERMQALIPPTPQAQNALIELVSRLGPMAASEAGPGFPPINPAEVQALLEQGHDIAQISQAIDYKRVLDEATDPENQHSVNNRLSITLVRKIMDAFPELTSSKLADLKTELDVRQGRFELRFREVCNALLELHDQLVQADNPAASDFQAVLEIYRGEEPEEAHEYS